MSSIHNLWHAIKSRVCHNHGVSLLDFNNGSLEGNRARNRTAQLFVLEMILYKHRLQYATIFQPLDGKDALYHLIFTKTNWKLIDIKQLSLEECLFVIQDELRMSRVPEEAKHLLNAANLPEAAFIFEELPEEDWAPKENSTFLASM
ncbi:ECs1072 family phage-associated protein [Serratia sp. IR-2025]